MIVIVCVYVIIGMGRQNGGDQGVGKLRTENGRCCESGGKEAEIKDRIL